MAEITNSGNRESDDSRLTTVTERKKSIKFHHQENQGRKSLSKPSLALNNHHIAYY